MLVERKIPRATLRRLFDEGRTMVEMSAILGVSDRTIARKLRQMGIEPRSRRNTLARMRWEDIEPMVRFGLSYQVIARIQGMSDAAVGQMAKRNGVTRRKGEWPRRTEEDWIAHRMRESAQQTRRVLEVLWSNSESGKGRGPAASQSPSPSRDQRDAQPPKEHAR